MTTRAYEFGYGSVRAIELLRPAWKNLLRDQAPTLPIADMRPILAAIDDRPFHSGGGCTLSKQTPRSAAVAISLAVSLPTDYLTKAIRKTEPLGAPADADNVPP
jgi:hypothetical protein